MKNKLPPIGKITPEIFEELIFPNLGAKRKEVIVGPQNGVDVGILEIGDNAYAFTTDPVFIVPEYGFERAAWFAIHILVSDVVTSGLIPSFLSIDLNLPMEINEKELEVMWRTIHRECEKMGIAIISGHTARYENCHYPMVGGATVVAYGRKSEYVSPKFIRPGDKIIITKGPAIEAAGIFAAMFPERIERVLGKKTRLDSEKLFYQMSVYRDAMTAIKIGVREKGVSAMHDATECGIIGGVFEIASASGFGAILEKEKIVVNESALKICKYLGIDPYNSISEGTLILTAREPYAKEIVNAFSKEGIPSSICGEITEDNKIQVIEGGVKRRVSHPRVDPFWEAFYKELKKN